MVHQGPQVSITSDRLLACWCAVDKTLGVNCDHISDFKVTLPHVIKTEGKKNVDKLVQWISMMTQSMVVFIRKLPSV